MILETKTYTEHRPDGSLLITGAVGIVATSWSHLYETRSAIKGYEGTQVCRVGPWTKFNKDGTVAWVIDYSNGLIK
jgi:hypothetical protein